MRPLLEREGWTYHDHSEKLTGIKWNEETLVALRDPVDRFVSLYSLMVNSGNHAIPTVRDFIDDQDKFMMDVGFDRWGYLYRPQVVWVVSDEYLSERETTVIRFRFLREDAMDKVGIELPDVAPRFQKVEVTDDERVALKRIYQEDYERLGSLF